MKKNTIPYWVTLFICCGLSASSIGICSNSIGVFFSPASAELGVGQGAFALHATISNLCTGIFSLWAIWLLRKYPFRAVLSAGILLAGGATMLMAVSSELWMFYLLGALRGIGCAFFATVVVTYIIGNWFEANLGFAVGVTLSFSGLSGACFSPMFSYLIGLWGWRTSFLAMGIVIIALALPGSVLFLEAHPGARGLLPYGKSSIEQRLPISFEVSSSRPVLILSWPVVAMSVFALLASFISGLTQFFPAYAQSYHSAAMLGAFMVSAAMIGNIVSKLVIGILSDRLGALNATMIMVSATLAALVCLCGINPTWNEGVTFAIALLFGSTYSVGAVGTSLVTREVAGKEGYARIFPYVSMFGSFGYAVSMTIIGSVYDIWGSYQISVVGAAVFALINLGLLWGLRSWLFSKRLTWQPKRTKWVA